MRTLGFTAHSALRTHGRPWEALRAVDACGMGMQPWHTCGRAGVRAGVRAGDSVWSWLRETTFFFMELCIPTLADKFVIE